MIRRYWQASSIVGVVCWLAMFVGCGGQSDDAPPPSPATNSAAQPNDTAQTPNAAAESIVSAAELAQAFVEDGGVAGEKYGFKAITVSGVVEAVLRDETAKTTSIRLTGCDRGGGQDPVKIECTLQDATAQVDAQPGQTAKVKGRCGILTLGVVMITEAELVEVTGAPSAQPAPPAANGLNVAHIAPQFYGAVIVHPARLVKSPLVAAALDHPLIRGAIQQSGIDPANVEHFILLIDPAPAGDHANHQPSLIASFKDPIDLVALAEKMIGDLDEADHNGAKYFRGFSSAAWMPDERTICVAPESSLHEMMSAGQSPASPLIDRLKRLDLDHDLVGAFVAEPVRKLAEDALASTAGLELPEQFAGLAALPNKIQAGHVSIDLSGGSLLRITVEATDQKAADDIKSLADGALQLGKSLYPQVRDRVAMDLPPGEDDEMLQVVDNLVNGLNVTQDKLAVTIDVPSPAGLDKLGGQLIELAMSVTPMDSATLEPAPPLAPSPQPMPMPEPASDEPAVVRRTWKNNTGEFSVDAEMVELLADKVTLKKNDGSTITVPINILSDEDQAFLQSHRELASGPVAVDDKYTTDLAAKAVEWIKANNAFEPGGDSFGKLVADVQAKVEKQVAADRPFEASLGSGLMKSGKMTILAGQGADLFVLVPTDEMAAERMFPEFNMVFHELAELKQTGHSKPLAKISSLRIDNAQRLDGTEAVTGSIQFEKIAPQTGNFAIRLVCMSGNKTITLYDFLDKTLPNEKSELTFSLDPINSTGVEHKGQLVVFVELCSFLDPSGEGDVIIVSNALAELVNVAGE